MAGTGHWGWGMGGEWRNASCAVLLNDAQRKAHSWDAPLTRQPQRKCTRIPLTSNYGETGKCFSSQKRKREAQACLSVCVCECVRKSARAAVAAAATNERTCVCVSEEERQEKQDSLSLFSIAASKE